jgi:hypothetical protein
VTDYILSIFLGVFFAAVGFGFLRLGILSSRVKQQPGCIPGILMLIGIGGMGVGLGLALAVLLLTPTPRHRTAIIQHILHTPPDQIIKVTIRARGPAGAPCPLVSKDLTVTDREDIRRIALALGKVREDEVAGDQWDGARYWFWHAPIELTTKDGTFYFRAGVSRRRGANVAIGTDPDGEGWRLARFRADELARVLEQLRDREGKK